jgi:hypothetical protein
MPDDIRTVAKDEYWDHFERMWTGLLSYRYLGKLAPGMDEGVDVERMVLRHDMRNAAGGIMAAPLCIASPESGGMADDAFVPNPIIASMQVLDDARDVREITMVRETVKLGRTMGFSRTRIVDLDHPERVIALSQGMGVSIGETPGGYQKVHNEVVPVVDSPDLPPLPAVFGATRRADGHWQLGELSDELSSPDAALHLGPIHVVLEAAAVDLAAARAGTDRLQVEDWNVMFAARGKVGPFRVSGEAYAGNLGRVGVQLSLHDEGNGDRVITTGQAMFRPV